MAQGQLLLPVECAGDRCMVVEYEEAMAGEAAKLVDALALRLVRYDMKVRIGDEPSDRSTATESGPAEGERESAGWVVHLRGLASGFVLIAVDNRTKDGGEDLVREIQRGETVESTAWSLAIVVEDAISPYLIDQSATALGAGLSIIEPPEVAGTKKKKEKDEEKFPKLKTIGLALTMYPVLDTDDFIAGPRFAVNGLFAKRLVTGVSAGWAGWANFEKDGVDGSMSYLPIDMMIGYIILLDRMIELSVTGGVTVGFTIYKTSYESRDRSDMVFSPTAQVSGKMVFNISGPIAIYADGGVAVPIVRDSLENDGRLIYEQAWILPVFDIGLELKI